MIAKTPTLEIIRIITNHRWVIDYIFIYYSSWYQKFCIQSQLMLTKNNSYTISFG